MASAYRPCVVLSAGSSLHSASRSGRALATAPDWMSAAARRVAASRVPTAAPASTPVPSGCPLTVRPPRSRFRFLARLPMLSSSPGRAAGFPTSLRGNSILGRPTLQTGVSGPFSPRAALGRSARGEWLQQQDQVLVFVFLVIHRVAGGPRRG